MRAAATKRVVAVVAAVVLTSGVWVPANAVGDERVASACEKPTGASWAVYTQAQTFRVKTSQITRAEARLMFFESFKGPITARIVLRPRPDVDGVGGPGITVAEMVTEVEAGRHQVKWVSFVPPEPVNTVAVGVTTTDATVYSLEIDFPVDQFPGPVEIAFSWMGCEATSPEGRAYVVVGASQYGRVVADDGGPEPVLGDGTLDAVPASGPYRAHHTIEDFQYRIIGR